MYCNLPLNNRTGSEIFDRLFRHEPIATLLESPVTNTEQIANANGSHFGLTRYSICAGSPETINQQLQIFTPAVGQILDCLRGLLATPNREKSDLPAHLPFTGGWLGWLGYELAWEIEKLPDRQPDPLPFPVAYWYEPKTFAILDHWEQILYLSANTIAELDDLVLKLAQSNPIDNDLQIQTSLNSSIEPPTGLHFSTSEAQYQQAIIQAQKYIQAGDIFQTNLSLRFSSQTNLDSWQI